jgi:hypothetical protein
MDITSEIACRMLTPDASDITNVGSRFCELSGELYPSNNHSSKLITRQSIGALIEIYLSGSHTRCSNRFRKVKVILEGA